MTSTVDGVLWGWVPLTPAAYYQPLAGGVGTDGICVTEMPDDIVFCLDWSTMKFLSNGGFRKRTGPDGSMYYTIRNTTGYQYVVDMCLYGEMQHTKPGNNGVIYGISY